MSGETITNTHTVRITPEIAAAMLSANAGNRRLRSKVVQVYADQMRRGQWKCTHQAIAVDCNGNLVDGQHRLSAIVMSGCPQLMLVVEYSHASEAMQLPVDRHLVRAAYDILKVPRKEAEIASILLSLAISQHGRSVPVDKIGAVIAKHGDVIRSVLAVSRSKVKQRASAAAQAGVVVRCIHSSQAVDEILEQYAAFVLMETQAAWPSVASLYRVFDREKGMEGMQRTRMRVCKVYQAFDPQSRNRVVRSGWCENTFRVVREVLVNNEIV